MFTFTFYENLMYTLRKIRKSNIDLLFKQISDAQNLPVTPGDSDTYCSVISADY